MRRGTEKDTTRLELRYSNSNSLRVAVADANADLLDTGFLSSGSSGAVELKIC
jgi:hypothetical protein